MGDFYVEIQPFNLPRGCRVTRRELQTILHVSGRFIRRDVDLLSWTSDLVAYGLLDDYRGRELQRKLALCEGSRADEFVVFLKDIVTTVAFRDFVNIAYRQGMPEYANALNRENYGELFTRMGIIEVAFSGYVQLYYSSMKSKIDNGVFIDPRNYLLGLIEEFKEGMETAEDEDSRQFNAEKLVAVYVLTVPLHPTVEARVALLENMRNTFHPADNPRPAVDSGSADIVFAGKMAITHATAGDFDSARRSAEQAENLSMFNQSSLAKIVARHDHQFIHLLEHLRSGSAENLSTGLRVGDEGLREIQDEPDDVRYLWNRLMMLYKAMSLLGIHPNFTMTDTYPAPIKIEQAKEVLRQVRDSFYGIETRREMIYSLCMARAYERTDTQLAIVNMEKAVRLSSDRTSFHATETAHLQTYLRQLKALEVRHGVVRGLWASCGLVYRGSAVLALILAWLCWVVFLNP